MRSFAYGGETYEGTSCPMVAADGNHFRCNDLSTTIHRYDLILQKANGPRAGIVSEDDAKGAWLEAIAYVENLPQPTLHARCIAASQDVAIKLGWMPSVGKGEALAILARAFGGI